ncbi:hypothetical protein CYMTET_40716 [Cymbomonas tetramitiformis]|uniref:Uncharacterized protein n=1 Tax=Cymbomonas tetramitiformis TaxID=36881 RepID=A0AAE0F2Z8_9CHLO|nr:hypothetical protein CYMTET_40716 [Cymbomonas tetramitiformis]
MSIEQVAEVAEVVEVGEVVPVTMNGMLLLEGPGASVVEPNASAIETAAEGECDEDVNGVSHLPIDPKFVRDNTPTKRKSTSPVWEHIRRLKGAHGLGDNHMSRQQFDMTTVADE